MTATKLADVTDPRFTDDQRAVVARFESAPTPPEVREVRVVEEVARRARAEAFRAAANRLTIAEPQAALNWCQDQARIALGEEPYRDWATYRAAQDGGTAAQDGGAEEAVHGDACQIGSPWFLRDIGWLADGDISVEDLHSWRIYLGGYDNSQPVPSEACAYALVHEPDWRLASLRHAPNGLPVWVRAAGDRCPCDRAALAPQAGEF